MEIKNSNSVLRLHCDDSDGFFWTQSMSVLQETVPGRIAKRQYGDFESSEFPRVLFRKIKRDSTGKMWKTKFFDDRIEMTFTGRNCMPKLYPHHTHVVFVEAPESATYGKRLRFMGCYKLTSMTGLTFTFSLVSREFDMNPAGEAETAA